MKLIDLGFDSWFEAHAPEYYQEGCSFARISAVDRGTYLIRNEEREVPAELTGRLFYLTADSADLPCVGDWVTAQYYDNDTAAIIHRVFPRRTWLRRKRAGEDIGHQMIAANLDAAFIIQSCHFDFNPRRLERYLVMAADGQVESLIILTKTDLIAPEELARQLALVSSVSRARVIALSNITGAGFADFQQVLAPGRTYCLLGSSGVGKTTLINRLLGLAAYETKAVSGTGEGTHTTTRRQLIVLAGGALLVDTPGMRELGLVGAEAGIAAGFEEFVGLAATCRYADCHHDQEPGCAVQAAIAAGKLSAARFASYSKLKKESEFYGMSALDKRKKAKAFGRFIKAAKKNLKDR